MRSLSKENDIVEKIKRDLLRITLKMSPVNTTAEDLVKKMQNTIDRLFGHLENENENNSSLCPSIGKRR